MPVTGEKSPEYPFGFGCCLCGCGKVTKVVGGVHLKFFHRSHNPQAVEIVRESARQQARRMFASPEPPPIKRLTPKAVAKEQVNNRLAQTVAWTKANPDFIKWHRKKLRAKSNETAKHYCRERRKRDPIFKLLAYVRGRIRGALKRKTAKKSNKTEQLLGCSAHELKMHLEILFKDGMSWNNYGKWHVDHIKPCCSFDLTNPEEQEACFHYSNLQPLWAEDNLKKSGCHAP